jgi:hypothetical protein
MSKQHKKADKGLLSILRNKADEIAQKRTKKK